MAQINRSLIGIAQEVSLGGGSKLKSNSDGVVQVSTNAGALGEMLVDKISGSEFHSDGGHLIFKAQTNDCNIFLNNLALSLSSIFEEPNNSLIEVPLTSLPPTDIDI